MNELAVPQFSSSYQAFSSWITFSRNRSNIILNYYRAQDAAMRGDPAAVEHWKAWCYWVAEQRLLGEL